MLSDYFELNIRDENARQFFYTEIPSHYVFKKITINNNISFQWCKRKNSFKAIGRMYSVSPSQTDLFHLRLLLLNVKGAKSFQDLKIVCDHSYCTYIEACLALGSIKDNFEWTKAIEEASS